LAPGGFLDTGGTEVARAECIPEQLIGRAYADVSIPEDGSWKSRSWKSRRERGDRVPTVR
jgi:hypothetical protein